MGKAPFIGLVELLVDYDNKALDLLMGLDRSLFPEFDAELLSVVQSINKCRSCLHPNTAAGDSADDCAKAGSLIWYLEQRQKFLTCYYKSVALHTGAKVPSHYINVL